MLSEAHQSSILVRFVAIIIIGLIKFISKKINNNEPMCNRSIDVSREFVLERIKTANVEKIRLEFKSKRRERSTYLPKTQAVSPSEISSMSRSNTLDDSPRQLTDEPRQASKPIAKERDHV